MDSEYIMNNDQEVKEHMSNINILWIVVGIVSFFVIAPFIFVLIHSFFLRQ